MRKLIVTLSLVLSFSIIFAQNDTILPQKDVKQKKVKNSTLAATLSAIIPGAGQVYNGKYYKPPFIYAGFYGSFYYTRKYYFQYRAYKSDILLLQDTTNINPVPVTGDYTINDLQTLAGKLNKVRRQRDTWVLVGVGVWAYNIIDAYIDAEMSNFDVSEDLTLHIYPQINYNTVSIQPEFLLTFQFNIK